MRSSSLCFLQGRVRVISRSSGDRTLLQLPVVFSPSTSVTDMAVYGNRLAGVTSDGGLVVWELPDIITDDVPYVSWTVLHESLSHLSLHVSVARSCSASYPPRARRLFIPSNGTRGSKTPWLWPPEMISMCSTSSKLSGPSMVRLLCKVTCIVLCSP
jgi:hypothetical protein